MAKSNFLEATKKYANRSFLIYEAPDSKYDKLDVTNSTVDPTSEILLDIATEKNYDEYGEDCILTRIGVQNNVHILIDMNFSKETGALSREDLENYFHTFGQIIAIGVPPVPLFGDNCWVISFFKGGARVVRRMYGTEHIIRGIRVKFKEYVVGDEFLFGDPNMILLELVDEKKGTIKSEESCIDCRRVDFDIRVVGDESSRERALVLLNEVLKTELGKIDRELGTMQRFLTRNHDQKYFEIKMLSISANTLLRYQIFSRISFYAFLRMFIPYDCRQERGQEKKSNPFLVQETLETRNEYFDIDSVLEVHSYLIIYSVNLINSICLYTESWGTNQRVKKG